MNLEIALSNLHLRTLSVYENGTICRSSETNGTGEISCSPRLGWSVRRATIPLTTGNHHSWKLVDDENGGSPNQAARFLEWDSGGLILVRAVYF